MHMHTASRRRGSRASAPEECEAETEGPELSALLRWSFAAASIGVWSPVFIFSALRNTLYVIHFGVGVQPLSIVNIVMGWWNALNGPFIARWADAGVLNRLSLFSPAEAWGRRAPWILLGTPLAIAGTAAIWVPPSHEESALVAWYAGSYFLLVNGVTAQMQAYLASIQELFTTGASRKRAIARQVPFLTVSQLVSAVLPVIAFSYTPDTTETCCIPASGCPQPDEHDSLPCVCYRDAPDLFGVHDYRARSPPPPPPPLSPSEHPPSAPWAAAPWVLATDAFAPDYVAQCAAAANASADGLLSEALKLRADACGIDPETGEPSGVGTEFWRFGLVAGLIALMGTCAFLAVAPARRTPISLEEAGGQAPLSLCASLRATFRLHSFRVYAAIMFLSQCYMSHLLTNISLYLVYVVGIDVAQVGFLMGAMMLPVIATRVLSLPLYLWLLQRAHPASVYSVLRAIEAGLVVLFFLLLKAEGNAEGGPQMSKLTATAAAAGAVLGVTQSPNDIISHMLMGWAIDEDGVERRGLRREGMFYACNGVCQHLSEVVVALILASYGWAGFDPKQCPSEQPASAVTAIELSFLVFGPVVLALLTLLGFAYPIRGERLARLNAQVAVLNEDRSRRITERNVSRPASTRGTASTRTLAEVVFRSRGSRPDEVALSEQLTTSSVPYSEPASEAGGAAASAEAASAEAPDKNSSSKHAVADEAGGEEAVERDLAVVAPAPLSRV